MFYSVTTTVSLLGVQEVHVHLAESPNTLAHTRIGGPLGEQSVEEAVDEILTSLQTEGLVKTRPIPAR